MKNPGIPVVARPQAKARSGHGSFCEAAEKPAVPDPPTLWPLQISVGLVSEAYLL